MCKPGFTYSERLMIWMRSKPPATGEAPTPLVSVSVKPRSRLAVEPAQRSSRRTPNSDHLRGPNLELGTQMPDTEKPSADELEDAADRPQPSLLREYWDFLRYSKKWWLAPIILLLLLAGLLAALAGTAAAPFIYPLY